MTPRTVQQALSQVDREARSAGFVDRLEREKAETWLEAHRGREALLLGIASLLRRLDNLPKSR